MSDESRAQAEHVVLSVRLPADVYSRVALLAGVYQTPVEVLAAELLNSSVVLCTEAEHGPALAGMTMSRTDLEALERGRLEMERDTARADLGRLRAELRRIGARLVRLAEGEEPGLAGEA